MPRAHSDDTVHVPVLDFRLQYASMREDTLSALTRICDFRQFIMGPEVDPFESEAVTNIAEPGA